MTPNKGEEIKFWAHRQLAKNFHRDQKILTHAQFESMDWVSIHRMLHALPRLFQLLAANMFLVLQAE